MKRRKDRDMERLKLLEQLGAPTPPRLSTPVRGGQTGEIARYTRFRHVAAFILVVAMCAAAIGAAGAVIETCGLFRANVERAGGMLRVLAWVLATLTSYGLLKCAGEALLLLADTAELANSMHEQSADRHAGEPR